MAQDVNLSSFFRGNLDPDPAAGRQAILLAVRHEDSGGFDRVARLIQATESCSLFE
jgi:hypothetical protein